MPYPSTVLGPGQGFYFFTEPDEFGNEEYTGQYIVVGPTEDINTGEKEVLPAPIPPTYAQRPIPVTTTPPPVEPPGSRVFQEFIREGIEFQAGDLQLVSTGEIAPESVYIGYAAFPYGDIYEPSDEIVNSDNSTLDIPSYQSTVRALYMRGFNIDIPDDAIITGIKVKVERRVG